MGNETSDEHSDDVNLFISHKADDKAAAIAIKDILQKHSGRLKVQISEEIHGGAQWRQRIIEMLRTSKVMLLLYTDPTADWGWCLYEAGLFTPLDGGESPVVCLYNPNTTVEQLEPLKSFQAVQTRVDELVRQFLSPLYRSTQLTKSQSPLNKNLKDEDLKQIAKAIAAAIAPKRVEWKSYLHHIVISVPPGTAIHDQNVPSEEAQIPDEARVVVEEAKEGSGLPFLNIDEDSFTWGDLKHVAKKGSGRFWLDELKDCIVAAARKRHPPVGTATLRAVSGGSIYRPLLAHSERENGIPVRFHVLFNREIEPEETGGLGSQRVLFNLLKLGNRFRWEILEPYLKEFKEEDADELPLLFRRISESIDAIEEEARRRYLSRDVIESSVGSENLREKLRGMFDEWGELRKAVRNAEREVNRTDLVAHLDAILNYNIKFIEIVADEYHAVLKAELDGN